MNRTKGGRSPGLLSFMYMYVLIHQPSMGSNHTSTISIDKEDQKQKKTGGNDEMMR